VRVGTSNATLGGNPMVGFLRVHAEEEVNRHTEWQQTRDWAITSGELPTAHDNHPDLTNMTSE